MYFKFILIFFLILFYSQSLNLNITAFPFNIIGLIKSVDNDNICIVNNIIEEQLLTTTLCNSLIIKNKVIFPYECVKTNNFKELYFFYDFNYYKLGTIYHNNQIAYSLINIPFNNSISPLTGFNNNNITKTFTLNTINDNLNSTLFHIEFPNIINYQYQINQQVKLDNNVFQFKSISENEFENFNLIEQIFVFNNRIVLYTNFENNILNYNLVCMEILRERYRNDNNRITTNNCYSLQSIENDTFTSFNLVEYNINFIKQNNSFIVLDQLEFDENCKIIETINIDI